MSAPQRLPMRLYFFGPTPLVGRARTAAEPCGSCPATAAGRARPAASLFEIFPAAGRRIRDFAVAIDVRCMHVKARGMGESSKPARAAWCRAGARFAPGRALLFGQMLLGVAALPSGVPREV